MDFRCDYQFILDRFEDLAHDYIVEKKKIDRDIELARVDFFNQWSQLELFLKNRDSKLLCYDLFVYLNELKCAGNWYKELNFFRKELHQKYLLDVQNLKEELALYCKRIEDCSRFSTRWIGLVIADLIKDYEQINYFYGEAKRHIHNGSVFGKTLFLKLIIQKSKDNQSYFNQCSGDFERWVDDGKVLKLHQSGYPSGEEICFYRVSRDGYSIVSLIDLGRFPYVKEFIDFVISYRMKSSSLDIPYRILRDLKQQFICEKREKEMMGVKKYHF